MSMIRVPLVVLLLVAGLAGCANGPGRHGGPPPQDPADYHGAPTDNRPPSMVPAPVSP
ncbi:hypothetical protein [Paraburkholderia terricola]|uniref:Lipoprotein-attachment site-containing protein n=1 Tax=Paraburkholderia terricola TaxID=169427 RepID=A0ABU1LT98_9BURK|nr:hypothetical protein [Paraburkholderia terricola]MDR6409967.1 hypothetical protein [Paraburkholderia terricola]MDR6480835.1 hypothetical protein [Paraburkholderia terricola]